MNVILRNKFLKDKNNVFALLIGLFLSSLLLGVAYSSITLGVIATYCLWNLIINKRLNKIDKDFLLSVVLYIYFALSLLWTVNTDSTLRGLGRTVTLIVIPLIFWSMPRLSYKNFKLILEIFTKANFIYALLFLISAGINYYETRSLSVLTYHELVSVLRLNSIYVSIYFLVSVSYLLSKKDRSKIDIVILFFLINMILLLSSKMTIISMLIILIYYVFFVRGLKYFMNYKVIISVAVIFILILVSSTKIVNRFVEEKATNINEVLTTPVFNRIYPWTGSSMRLLQLRILYEQMQEESIFWKGFGLYASRENVEQRHIKFNTYYGYHEYNYHNQYAQIFSELGIFGLFIFLFFLYYNFKKALKSSNFVFISFMLIMSLAFISESFLWVHRGIFFFAIFYCLLIRTDFQLKIKH